MSLQTQKCMVFPLPQLPFLSFFCFQALLQKETSPLLCQLHYHILMEQISTTSHLKKQLINVFPVCKIYNKIKTILFVWSFNHLNVGSFFHSSNKLELLKVLRNCKSWDHNIYLSQHWNQLLVLLQFSLCIYTCVYIQYTSY